MNNKYLEYNKELKNQVTRNSNNIIGIKNPSFWITDKKLNNNEHYIEIGYSSIRNYLKVNQKNNQECLVLPIDGNKGVFREKGLIVSKPKDFYYITNRKRKPVGDCDCLIVNDTFWFIEFKIEVTSTNPDQIKENFDHAYMQLAKSKTSFEENNSIKNNDSNCLIIFPKVFPSISKGFINNRVKFKSKYKSNLKIISINESLEL